MDSSIFTVFYEGPYWVGIFERTDEDGYAVARVVFGSEPTDAQILDVLAKNYPNCISYHSCNTQEEIHHKLSHHMNPKRRQREAAALLGKTGTSTKAQDMLKVSYEAHKQASQQRRHQQKESLMEEKYFKRQEKKKQKRRGR